MAETDTVSAYIVDTQIAIFEDARADLQLTIVEIARRAKLPTTTVNAWAQGRNALSLWGLKKLLRVKELAPLLSRLFEPEEYMLVAVMAGVDHDEVCKAMGAYMRDKHEAHAATSPAGPAIAPCEDARLRAHLAVVTSIAA